MSQSPISLSSVNLDNCDQEPIHIPGFIQPHGVLLAFDAKGVLTHASRDARNLLGSLPPLGSMPSASELGGGDALALAFEGMCRDAADEEEVPPVALELEIGEAPGEPTHDVVLHAFDGRVIIEYERRAPGQDALASFALLAHRGMGRLRGRRDIGPMLEEAVRTVREITGFDRVMAYRFHHDDSGEVVAETVVPELDPYLHRRFPAADIPAQARRLYIINTLRLIADVGDAQVPIEALPGDATPLDLSHAVLRSVSPIHIEYLKNIGVAASMSVSIVVGGRLWGLIACHHRTPHRVPFAIRMACDVLSQMVSSSVQTALERAHAARRSAAADLRTRLVDVVLQSEDAAREVGALGSEMQQVIAHDALLFAHSGKQTMQGELGPPAARALLKWIDEQPDDLLSSWRRDELPEPLRRELDPFCGVLALRFDRMGHGALVFLRAEQTHTVTWSGPLAKAVRVGPLGTRLTPGGSFAEWRQEVAGTAVPWDEADLSIARQMLDELGRATAARAGEMERARARLLAVLGHDLRDPLQTISMAARILEQGNASARVGQRIAASTGRMGRLITQVLDMSRLHGGLGLGLQIADHDLAALVHSLVDDAKMAHPDLSIELRLAPSLLVPIDADRIAQVVGNLISNARHHGQPGEPIALALEEGSDGHAVLVVSNFSEPIPPEVVKVLFEPLKAGSMGNSRNPNGLGLGLYIAAEIVKGHQGRIHYGYDDAGRVSFTVELPLARPSDASRPGEAAG
ncbi:Histidine kinase [Burkholderiales bacterium 8X]|nr:Histidine kinase [Burkholderiales bacterium 8X]